MTATNLLWGPAAIGPANIVNISSTLILNASNRAIAQIFNVPVDGSITDVGFLVTARGGTPPNFNVGLVTLDTSGRPSTSAYGGSAITAYNVASTGWKWVTLSTPATGAAGDFMAAYLYPTGTAPDGTNNITVAITPVAQTLAGLSQNAGSWTASMGIPMAIRYSTGAVYGFAVNTNTVHITYNSGSSPNEMGLYGQFPANMTISGARVGLYTGGYGTASTYDVTLYDASSNVLAATSVSDKDFTDDLNYIDVFWDGVSVTANTDYRLAVKATTSTNGNVTVSKWILDSSDGRAAWPEGARWQWTERTGAGAWSNTATAVSYMGFWVSAVTFVQGSGSGGAEWGFVG